MTLVSVEAPADVEGTGEQAAVALAGPGGVTSAVAGTKKDTNVAVAVAVPVDTELAAVAVAVELATGVAAVVVSLVEMLMDKGYNKRKFRKITQNKTKHKTKKYIQRKTIN